MEGKRGFLVEVIRIATLPKRVIIIDIMATNTNQGILNPDISGLKIF
jgi:hypothetical protein